jgi:hypothetical protein
LGVYFNGASNTGATLTCNYNTDSCAIKGVGCGGSAAFYVETVDGNGNPVAVTTTGGLGILVGSGASPPNVTIPTGSFSSYPSSVIASLPTGGTCSNGHPQSETVKLSAALSSGTVILSVKVSSN